MPLPLLFSPIEMVESPSDCFGSQVVSFHAKQEIPETISAFFFTVGDCQDQQMMNLRETLFRLKELSMNISLLDFGHLRGGNSQEELLNRLEEAITLLLPKKLPIVIVGTDHFLDVAIYKALETTDELISVVEVDAVFDIIENSELQNDRRLGELFRHRPNYLFDYCHLGSQRHLNSKKVLGTLEQLNFDYLSLGKIKESLKETEPYLRKANFLTIDLSSLKKTDFEGCKPNRTFGLSAEELAQLTWYAGNSPSLKAMGFWGYQPRNPNDSLEALAVSIWYAFEGFLRSDSNRLDINGPNFTRYFVQYNNSRQSITFFKNEVSDQWWMEVHYPRKKRNTSTFYVPCSYRDYQEALNGEIPEKWIRAVNQMI